MAAKPLRIFLSSTFEDLKVHRAQVTTTLNWLGGVVVSRMETFLALPGHNVAECTKRVADADALVLILAHRLGWVPTVAEGGDGRKSITRLEAEAAAAAGLPIFCFMIDETAAWSAGRETDAVAMARTPDEMAATFQRVRELADFKAWAGQRPRELFADAGELASKVLASIANWRIESGDQVAAGEREIFDYLRDVIHDHGFLDIRGIAVQSGPNAFRPRIENLYTPLSCRDSRAGLDRALQAGPIPLTALLDQSRRILIEGGAGAGKSTFLRLVATILAHDVRQDPCARARTWREAYLGLPAKEPPRIPIFLRLAGLVEILQERAKADDRHRLLDLFARDRGTGLNRKVWERRLAEGRAFLLLDGLDEIADLAIRQRIFAIFADAEKSWKSPLIVTSRPFRTEELRARGFLVASVEAFGDPEIREFLRLWVSILYQEDSPTSLKETAEIYRQTLEHALLSRPNIRELAANPVMLTCLAVVHWNEGRLPDARARVYRSVIHWLLEARKDQRLRDFGLLPEFASRTLAVLATAAMDGKKGKEAILTLSSAVALVASELQREKGTLTLDEREALAERWLLQECENSGVIEELAGQRLRFWHLTFQEFLAAFTLAQSDDWWSRIEPHLENAQWRETLDLFASCLFDARGAVQVDRLLELILARAKPGSLASEARAAALVGRFLNSAEACGYQSNPDLGRRHRALVEQTLEVFTRKGAASVSFTDRRTAAEALGRAGDPRLVPGADNLRPVPGTGIVLGIYPVTVEEYRHFGERGGYLDETLWSAAGWQRRSQQRWLRPESWSRQLRHPNWPIVGVSFFEAEAYCRWLSRLCRREVRLPTEAEWEAAATNPAGPYPWGGDEPDPELANFGPNIGDPTPVGLYPAGVAHCGHFDMAGNVCEWCSNPLPGGTFPLRGGSWRHPPAFLQSLVRMDCEPGTREFDVGFRVAVSTASLEP